VIDRIFSFRFVCFVSSIRNKLRAHAAPFDRGESAHMPPSIAASHESIPHRQARRVWNIPENHTWPLGAGRTAGEIRGKSIVWTARVFTGAPKFVEKSQKQIRSPFLVPLALLDLFSTSFVFSQRGAPIACRKMPILFRQSLTSLRATNRARLPMEIDELDANVIVVDDDLQAKWLKLVPGQVTGAA